MFLGWRRLVRLVLVTVLTICVLFSVSVAVFVAQNRAEVGQFLKVIFLIREEALEPMGSEVLLREVTRSMVGALKDPYSAYLDENQYRNLVQQISGSYGGVGLVISLDEEGRLKVMTPFKGGPALRKGIQSGDFIVQIDGQDTLPLGLEGAAGLMQGEPGTSVSLMIQRDGNAPVEYVITREIIIIPSVEAQLLPGHPDIGYINISSFSERTSEALQQSLKDIGATGLHGLILDLRNNPGGELKAAVEVASHFIPPGPVVYTVSRRETAPYMAEGGQLSVPLAVLINGGTASAAEIVAGAIKDTQSGILVGEKTFGKGRVQKVFALGNGSALKLTTEKYLTPAKLDINGQGVQPDVPVVLSPETTIAVLLKAPDLVADGQLQKALELLQASGQP